MPKSSALVELRNSGTPSTRPAPSTSFCFMPIRIHLKDAVCFTFLRDPSVPIFMIILLWRHSLSTLSPPGENCIEWSSLRMWCGSVSTYSLKVLGSAGIIMLGTTHSWYIAVIDEFLEDVTITGITVFQSTVRSDMYNATNGMGVAAMWWHIKVVTVCSINWWSISSPATVVDLKMQFEDGS